PYAALKADGSVVTWGSRLHGGHSAQVAEHLTEGVIRLYSTARGFTALKEDGSVISWGTPDSFVRATLTQPSQAITQPVLDILT
ncbi:hypothetical protein, partial [Limnospira sp. PMC 1249.20]|uniref:hypothetical protein n=1 Tax=Limnospira sp. PMC 1249.20 TaxID=2981047 RepID=UPI0028E0DA0A